jgi:hypothetical protein
MKKEIDGATELNFYELAIQCPKCMKHGTVIRVHITSDGGGGLQMDMVCALCGIEFEYLRSFASLIILAHDHHEMQKLEQQTTGLKPC